MNYANKHMYIYVNPFTLFDMEKIHVNITHTDEFPLKQ